MDRSRPTEDIAIYVGENWRPWSPADLVTTGLNGTYTAAVRIAQGLARRGYATTIYGEGEDAMYGDVRFRPWQEFDPALRRTAVSCFESPVPKLLDRPLNARVRILASHQPTYLGTLTPARAAQIDYLTTVSGYHEYVMRRQYPFVAHKVVRSRNGIDPERFTGPPRPRRRRVLYTSLADRGLDALLEMWPRIRAQVPDAELAYSYARLPDDHDSVLQGLLGERLHQPGVVPLGTVPGHMYPDTLREAMVWAHPSWSERRNMPYIELSCVSGMEAQAAGLHVVASAYGGLPETVRCGDLVREPHRSREWEDRFVASIVAGLTDREVQARAQRDGPAAMADLGWDGAAADVAALLERRRPNGRSVVVRPASPCEPPVHRATAAPRPSRAERRRIEREAKRARRRRGRRGAAAAGAVAVLGATTAAPAAAVPTVSYSSGVLTIAGDNAAPDAVSVTCVGGNVWVENDESLDPNEPNLLAAMVPCVDVTQIDVDGNLGGNSAFDLSGVTAAGGFTQSTPPAVSITGSQDGNDTLEGSGFNDVISGGGGGMDAATANAGSRDVIEVPAGGFDVTLTPGSASRSDGHATTLTGFEGARVEGTGLPEVLDASQWTGYFDFNAGGGNDRAVLQANPLSSVGSSFFGAAGTDEVAITRDFPFLALAPTTITGNGPDMAVAGLEQADIVGGAGPNFLDVFSWNRAATFDGMAGNDAFYAEADPNDPATFDGGEGTDMSALIGSGAFAVTPTAFAANGATVIQQSGTEEAFVLAGPSNDTFDASGFTGRAFFDAGAGDDTLHMPSPGPEAPDPNDPAFGDFRGGDGFDIFFRTGDQDFTLTDTLLSNPGGSELLEVEKGVLTGGPGANTFTVNTQSLAADVFGGASGDVFNAGPQSGASFFGGPDADTFNTLNGVTNAIDCGGDAGNVLNSDPFDTTAGCLTGTVGGGDFPDANDPALMPIPTTPPPAPPFQLVVPRTVTLNTAGVMTFTVDCPPGTGACSGEGVLRTAKPVTQSAVRRRIATLGKKRFTVPAGTKRKVRLKLTKKGFAIVRRAKRLRVKLTVTARRPGAAATRRSKTFVLKARKPRG